MRDVADILVPWAILTIALFALLDRDESRLTEEELARAWPPATRTLALAYFGVLAVPIHFGRTRRSWKGALLGVAVGLLAFGLDDAVAEGIDALPDGAMPALMVLAAIGFVAYFVRRSVRTRGARPR